MPVPANLIETSGVASADIQCPRLWMTTEESFDVTLKDMAGNPLTVPENGTVELSVREVDSKEPIVTLTGEATGSTATFDKEASQFEFPAVYRAIVTIKNSDGKPTKRMPLFIEIQYDGVTPILTTPVFINDIRQAVVDRCPQDNQMLSEVEFTDGEIATAICRAIDWWNDSAPDGAPYTFSTAAFPWGEHWIGGALGYLYSAKAMQLQRNRLPITGGGINTDDKAKADAYLKFGQMMMTEWRTWAASKMYQMNLSQWSGSVQDPLFGTGWGGATDSWLGGY